MKNSLWIVALFLTITSCSSQSTPPEETPIPTRIPVVPTVLKEKLETPLAVEQDSDCMTIEEMKAVTDRCLTGFEGKVYDVTDGKKFSLNGHFEHACGEVYSRELTNSAPQHKAEASDLLKKFYYKELCK